MSRKVVRSFFDLRCPCYSFMAMLYGWGVLRIRDIFVPSNHHIGQAFESWTGSSPLARFPPQPVQVSPSPPPATKNPSPKQGPLHISAKRVTRKNPRNRGREGRRAYLSFAPSSLSHFPGSPDGALHWPPQGDGAQARKSTSSGWWVAATPTEPSPFGT